MFDKGYLVNLEYNKTTTTIPKPRYKTTEKRTVDFNYLNLIVFIV